MIASNYLIVFVLSITLAGAKSSPFSKVYVQSGPDVIPAEYVSYGPPAVPTQKLGQLKAPLPNVVPVPCVGPSVSGQQLLPLPSPAKLVAYKAPVPSVPVVITPKKDDLSYQYSYVVYDENTGDQKAQAELSDNGVVQGQYSLIQPDGYVREVLYTADDLKGFNAVVNSFLPNKQTNEVKAPEDNKVVPCGDTKNAAFVELSETKNTSPPARETVSTEATTAVIELSSSTEGAQQISNGVLYYNDIIKCLQAALKGTESPKPTASPLTYVILNKPC